MYQLEPLPYLYQDLEPFIDTHTVGLHYQKHAKNYLNQLNGLLKQNRYTFLRPLNELYLDQQLWNPQDVKDILFNWGGVINHNLYFRSMGTTKKEPSDSLLEAIKQKYGSYEEFEQEFKRIALSLKGSGYTFLVADAAHQIEIINLPNQDTPLLHGYQPLFALDMWEHAYYLNDQNRKKDYLDNFFMIADFTYASNQY